MCDDCAFVGIMYTIVHCGDFLRCCCLYCLWISSHIYMDGIWHLRVCCISCIVFGNIIDINVCVQFLQLDVIHCCGYSISPLSHSQLYVALTLKNAYLNSPNIYKMAECSKEDWVSGLWFMISGTMLVASGLVSLLIVGPLTAKR